MKSRQPPKKVRSSDIFQTPPSGVEVIIPYILKEWKILEPACGEGQVVKTLEKYGFEVHGSDIMHGFDFLSTLAAPEGDFDCIITNPPYSLKTAWLKRCYEIGKPFALLLPLTALEGRERMKMYKEHGIQLLMPPGRINFGTPSGKGSSSWFFAAWFTWGFNLPEQLTFEVQ